MAYLEPLGVGHAEFIGWPVLLPAKHESTEVPAGHGVYVIEGMGWELKKGCYHGALAKTMQVDLLYQN
jgi:hypothetical protein